MHRPFHKYTHSGMIRDDSDFIRLRGEQERLVSQMKRDEGYLPVSDIPSLWSTQRVGKHYEFTLTMYFVYVGKKKAKEKVIWQGGRLVSYE